METVETGPGGFESFGHPDDDPSESPQDVEAESNGFEASVVAGCAEHGHEIEDALRESLGRGGEIGPLFEFKQNCLAISDVFGVDGRVREDPFDEPTVHGDGDALDLEREHFADQRAEKEIVCEMDRIPVTDAHRKLIESAIGFSGAGATEKCEVEKIEEGCAIGAVRHRWIEKVGQREVCELAPTNRIGAPRRSRQELADRRREAGLRAVKPAIVFAPHSATGVPPDAPAQQGVS